MSGEGAPLGQTILSAASFCCGVQRFLSTSTSSFSVNVPARSLRISGSTLRGALLESVSALASAASARAFSSFAVCVAVASAVASAAIFSSAFTITVSAGTSSARFSALRSFDTSMILLLCGGAAAGVNTTAGMAGPLLAAKAGWNLKPCKSVNRGSGTIATWSSISPYSIPRHR
jgi:hypothetical protein